jgi:hypothetical protein
MYGMKVRILLVSNFNLAGFHLAEIFVVWVSKRQDVRHLIFSIF